MVFLFTIPFLYSIFYESSNLNQLYSIDEKSNKIKTSDIAGNDLYAEQISTYLAGNRSLHKHSIFTNDTNILNNFDTSDPAFYRCNIFISASNGIQSEIFPFPLTTRNIEDYFATNFNSFAGFLYYDKELKSQDVKDRAERAFEIIKRKFKIDIINVNSSDPYFYPFTGYYPQWNILLEELTSNIPKDGYWKAFDINRLMDNSYYSSKHLSLSYALVNTPEFFQGKIAMGNDQIDFNTGAAISPFLHDTDFQDTFDQFNTILEENEDLFENLSSVIGINETASTETLDQISENIGNFSLAKNSHYTIVEVQYEGLDNGFHKIGNHEYQFDLFSSLNYMESFLEPSEKIYNNLMGTFLTALDTNVLCSEITNIYPKYSKFNQQLLDQLGLILYLADIDFDIQTLENYSFELLWRDNGGLKQNYVNPVNLRDDYDIINFLPMLGFTGIQGYPSGILEPLDDYSISYKFLGSDPNIKIQTKLVGENATYGAYREFNFNITARNVGNETAWGVPTIIPITLDEVFPILVYLEGGNPLYAEELKDSIWDIVDHEYTEYNSLEEFFNFDEDPKIFSFDTYGDGAADYYFPNPFNITNLYPYNEKMNEVIDILADPEEGYLSLIINLGMTTNELKAAFTNQYSVWNNENWKLEPGKKISYLSENYSISNLDSFTNFHEINFTIGSEEKLPNIIVGDEYGSTTPEMALNNDNESWVILSQQEDLEQQVEVQFLATNNSLINLVNNSIDRVSIEINLTDSSGGTQFEIFNFQSEEYQNLQSYLRLSENTTRIFSITKYNNTIDWLFQDSQNGDYTMIFRIRNQNSDIFNISINNIDIFFEDRDVNPYNMQTNIKYSSKNEIVRYYSYSNSITLSTENMASLVCFAELSDYTSIPGESVNYSIFIKNIGCETAKNISIEIPIPGILDNQNNLSIINNHLILKYNKLKPLEEKSIEFSFYIPNSGIMDDINVKYNNSIISDNKNLKSLSSNPENIFYNAPVDYNSQYPHLNIIDICLNTSDINPEILDLFNITLNVKNVGREDSNLNNISISTRDIYGDLKRIDDGLLVFNNITYNLTKSQKIIVNKTDWKGYFYPAINLVSPKSNNLIQIRKSRPLIIGNINFSIIKTVNKNQVEIGDIITINIKIENTGTICIKDLNINDMLGFPQDIFSLIDGRLIYKIAIINPNQILNFNYTLKAKTQAISSLQGASIEYYYLFEQKSISNELKIKVIQPKTIQFLFLLLPTIIGLAIIISYGIYVKKNEQKRQEIERNEIRILHLTSRDTILNIELNLKEYLTNDKDISSNNKREVQK